jgi:hypothetical protein
MQVVAPVAALNIFTAKKNYAEIRCHPPAISILRILTRIREANDDHEKHFLH